LDTAGFEQTQGKLGIANLNGQRLATTRTPTQHANRLACDEAKFTEATQRLRILRLRTRQQRADQRVAAARQVC
jgi:hypothetical protein